MLSNHLAGLGTRYRLIRRIRSGALKAFTEAWNSTVPLNLSGALAGMYFQALGLPRNMALDSEWHRYWRFISAARGPVEPHKLHSWLITYSAAHATDYPQTQPVWLERA